jgi:trans-AT polyketide synthase/acyltransferase/oxidoreductase domain-containing protein
MFQILPANLGNGEFKSDYHLRYAYLTGAMYKGIASVELVAKLGQAGLMGYFGTGGLRLDRIEAAIQSIQDQLPDQKNYGMNLLCNLIKPQVEEDTVKLFLKYQIKYVEAAAYMQITPALVLYRLKGLKINPQGKVETPHHILAKVSRPEVALVFMSPPPPEIVKMLVAQNLLTPEEAQFSEHIPMSNDICVEADSGGHTDQGVAYALMPAMQRLRDEVMAKYRYKKAIRVGAAGGIGTPEAAAAAFILGADFVMTGSINQCTVEAGTSDAVKDMLQTMNVQDTAYAPAGDMFEIGARVQVFRKGVFFPARANKLYDLYRQFNSLDDVDEKTCQQIQEKYFKRSFNEVWEETKAFYLKELPDEVTKAEQNPKHKMALIFRWYFIHTSRLAIKGIEDQKIDYQIHCGPALGAFNQWVKGTPLENWRHRHVDQIAEKLIQGTAAILTQRLMKYTQRPVELIQ